MFFIITLRVVSYELFLLTFSRFFTLARNGDWFTIEKTQCEVALFSGTIVHTYSWKDRFFCLRLKEVLEDCPSIIRHTEHVQPAGDVESVSYQPIIDGSSVKKLPLPVIGSTRGASSVSAATQSSDYISINSGDEDNAYVISSVTGIKLVKKEIVQEASSGSGGCYCCFLRGGHVCCVEETKRRLLRKKGEVEKTKVITEKKGEVEKKKVIAEKGKGVVETEVSVYESSMFVPKWQVHPTDTTKSGIVCHEMLMNVATPAERKSLSKLSDEDATYRIITQASHLPVGIQCIYTKAMAHGRHMGLIAGIDATSRGEAMENLHAFKPDSLPDFVSIVKKMEVLSYPYVEALTQMVDRSNPELGALERECLNKELCEQLLVVASVKRTLFEPNSEEGGDVGPLLKKLKMGEEPELVTSMSIPIDAPPLPFVRGEPAPPTIEDEGLGDLDGLYGGFHGSSAGPQDKVVTDEDLFLALDMGKLCFSFLILGMLVVFAMSLSIKAKLSATVTQY
ncbi:hypothetical protein Hanom_Chr03g00219731 [Helianthus anomalus]